MTGTFSLPFTSSVFIFRRFVGEFSRAEIETKDTWLASCWSCFCQIACQLHRRPRILVSSINFHLKRYLVCFRSNRMSKRSEASLEWIFVMKFIARLSTINRAIYYWVDFVLCRFMIYDVVTDLRALNFQPTTRKVHPIHQNSVCIIINCSETKAANIFIIDLCRIEKSISGKFNPILRHWYSRKLVIPTLGLSRGWFMAILIRSIGTAIKIFNKSLLVQFKFFIISSRKMFFTFFFCCFSFA